MGKRLIGSYYGLVGYESGIAQEEYLPEIQELWHREMLQPGVESLLRH